jgi:hypothetical protein
MNLMYDFTPVFVKGVKSVGISEILTILDARATLLATETTMPGLDPLRTELIRGQHYEVQLLIEALQRHKES